MHKSRLAGFIIDCRTGDLDQAARFWSQALGYSLKQSSDGDDGVYKTLDTPSDFAANANTWSEVEQE